MYICVENLHATGILQSMVMEPAQQIKKTFGCEIYFTSMERKSEINNIESVPNSIIGRRSEKAISLSNIFFHLIFLIRVLMKTRRVNVLHCRSYIATLIGLFCKILWKNKVIFDVRGYLIDEAVESERINAYGIKYKVLRSIENILFKYSDEIIVVSEAMYLDVRERFGRNSSIIRNPSNVNEGTFNVKKNKKILIYNGSLKDWHMPDLFFEVINIGIRNKVFDEVRIISSDKKIASSYLKKYSLQDFDNIKLISCNFAEVKNNLVIGSLGWCVIKPTYSKRFCWPVKFNEYLNSGMAIVVNRNIGDLESIVSDNNLGIVIDNEKSPTVIIEQMKDFYNDKEYIEINKDLESKLSWNKQIFTLYDLYK